MNKKPTRKGFALFDGFFFIIQNSFVFVRIRAWLATQRLTDNYMSDMMGRKKCIEDRCSGKTLITQYWNLYNSRSHHMEGED